MGFSIQEILDRYDRRVFYPYAFCEELLDREQELLNKIEELEAIINLEKQLSIDTPVVDLKSYSICEMDPTLQSNLMAFGLDCGAGWHPLIKELLDKLQNYVNAFPQLMHFRIVQIKEKWGGLCIYTNFGTDVINKCIEEYEKKSFTICEICGKPGKFRGDLSWVQTLCDDHYKETKHVTN